MNHRQIPLCDLCFAIKSVRDEIEQCQIMANDDLGAPSSLNYIYLAEGMQDALGKFEELVNRQGGCDEPCRRPMEVDLAI